MFRRRWSGLPEDPDFPIDLEKLGYAVQPETDEIRAVANPNFYFHYFRTKNTRHNDRQRFAFNLAVREVVHARLAALGLAKVPLPSPPPLAGDYHEEPRRQVPIFVSKDLGEADRVVLLFGEGLQQLGVLAHRVLGGPGGVDKGSVVSLVKALLGGDNHNTNSSSSNNDGGEATEKTKKKQDGDDCANTKTTKTGVILANTGERWWWPQGQRALTHRDSLGVKMKSCVHKAGSSDAVANLIPGSEDVGAHVRSVFERVLVAHNDNDDDDDEKEKKQEEKRGGFVAPGARVQIIAVGEAAAAVETYLDQNWGRWGHKVNCLAMLGDGKPVYELENEGFKKFLRERARIYITTQAPLGTPLANPEGNPSSMNFTSYGCPVLSSGETYYTELTLIKAKDAVLAFLDDAYQATAGRTYVNPVFDITYAEEDVPETSGWDVSLVPDVASSQD